VRLPPAPDLSERAESGTWFRAIQLRFWDPANPLGTRHTKTAPTRFNPGSHPKPGRIGFEILYLAENHLVAALEVQALLGSPPGLLVPNPFAAWVFIPVLTNLQRVADLTDVGEQSKLDTTVQELTGDWRGYDLRGAALASVPAPVGDAPTQLLGEHLFQDDWEGFRAVSARVPNSQILAIFPDNLLAGSWVEFSDPVDGTARRVTGIRTLP